MDQEKLLCPSAKCQTGALLLGVRQSNGMVGILPQPLPFTEEFVKIATSDGTAPEQKFRFANKCAKSGCGQWTGHSCKIAESISKEYPINTITESLPDCGIRSHCRWYAQEGPKACANCPLVVTLVSIEEIANHDAI